MNANGKIIDVNRLLSEAADENAESEPVDLGAVQRNRVAATVEAVKQRGLAVTTAAAMQRPNSLTFTAIPCAQLDAEDHSPTFLIDRVLVEGQPGFIGGAAKNLKTLVAVDMGMSLATATPFLGAFDVPVAVRVAYMSGEGGLSLLQDYGRRVAVSKGVALADVGGAVWCNRLPQLADLGHLDALKRFLTDNELQVLFLDPLYLCFPGDDAGNVLKTGKVLANLNRICVEAGCTPILIHHVRKASRDDRLRPPELSDLAWSGFQEFAGQWVLIGRQAEYDPERPGDHRLVLNVGGRAGHSGSYALAVHEGQLSDPSGRRWHVEVTPAAEARQRQADKQNAEQTARRNAAIERDRRKLSEALADFPNGETPNMLRTRAGLSGTRFNAALTSLLESGDVQEVELAKPNRKRPYVGYRLATHE